MRKVRNYFIALLCFALLIFSPEKNFAKEINRIAGPDRYKTAVEISKRYVKNTDRVIVLSGENYPDAISASAMSCENEYPILLTRKNMVSKEVIEEIKRVKAKEIILVGGESTISNSVEKELSKVAKVNRIAGKDRYQTSIKVFEYKRKLNPNSTKVVFASGKNFADALVAAPYIYSEGSIILYDAGCGIDLNKYSPELIFGGESSLPGFKNVKRIYGKDRYETSLKVAKEFNSNNIVFASGEDFPDALAGGLVAKKNNAPIVLVRRDKIEGNLTDYLKEKDIEKVIILGGKSSISKGVENKVEEFLKVGSKDENKKPTEPTKPTEPSKPTEPTKPTEPAPVLDKTNLEKEIEKAKEVLKLDMADSDKDKLQKEISNASDVLKNAKSQDEIDMAVEKLKEAVKNARKKVFVEIEDPLFRKVLNKNISRDREDSAAITKEEMESLKEISIFLDVDGNPTFGESFAYSILGEPKSLSGTKDFKFAVTRGMKSIKGIEYCVNLEKLKVNENEISDITPLKDLKNLKYLEIQRNRITDIKPLENLKNLEFLKLYNNLIEDVSPLANLTNLTGLDLHYNVTVDGDENNKIISKGITDISPLKNLTKLEFLDVYANRIDDVSILKDFTKLNDVDFTGNRVYDYTELADLISKLLPMQDIGMASIGFWGQKVSVPEKLTFTSNPLSFDNPYKGFDKLEKKLEEAVEAEELNIMENIEADVPGVTAQYDKATNKINLEIDNDTLYANRGKELKVNLKITFAGAYIWNIGEITIEIPDDIKFMDKETEDFYKELLNEYSNFYKKYTNLTDEANKKFSKDKKPIGDREITPEDLNMLKTFKVKGRNVTDTLVSPLKYAKNLEQFHVTLNDASLKREVTDFSFLKEMPKLKEFWYINNDYKNLQKETLSTIDFSANKEIEHINIQNTTLSNLFGLRGTNPKFLSLQNNNISNISQISKMTNLIRLDLDSNKITSIKGLENLKNLITLYLRDNPIEDISSLKGLENLEALHLRNTKIKDITALKELKKLHRLYVDENELNDDYFETIKSFKTLNTIFVDKINMDDFSWLKGNSVRPEDDPLATEGEDQARMATFKELNVELKADKKDIKNGKLTISNPITDFENNPVEQTDMDEVGNPIETNSNLQFVGDKIEITVSDDEIEKGNISESYSIYFEHPELSFGEYGGQAPSIFGKVVLNIELTESESPAKEFEKDGVTPVKYDLREKGFVTPVKNQYKDGSCRSFSSLAAMESFYKMKTGKDIDLSENNFETRQGLVFNNKSKYDQPRSGRDRNSDFGYLMSGNGPIIEKEDPYKPFSQPDMDIPNSISEDAYRAGLSNNGPIETNPALSVMGFEFLRDISKAEINSPEDENLKQIKQAIVKYGAVSSNIYMSHDGQKRFPYQNENCFNKDTSAYFVKKEKNIISNHAIAIVGWDNNFSKENFVSTNRPTIDGAWIVKDAQGKEFGDGGYFYVSYQTEGIGGDPYVFTRVEDPDTYAGIYQHDEMPFTDFMRSDFYSDIGGKTILLNAFKPNAGEELKEIGFYTTKRNAEFEIYLIEDFDKFEEDASDCFDEEEYMELIKKYKIYDNNMDTKGEHEYAGYHTIKLSDLNKELKFADNKRFALGIWVRNNDKEDPNHEWDMVVESKSTPTGKYAEVNKNETFAFAFGEFCDLGNLGKINACIKGYFTNQH